MTVLTLAPYAYLEMKSRELGMPEAYREDLTVHDKRMCDGLGPTEPFAWSVRPCGTHLILIDNRANEWAQAVARNKSESHYFVWTGEELREATAEQWVQWVNDKMRQLPFWKAVYERYTGWSKIWETFTCYAKDEAAAREHADHWNKRTWNGKFISIGQMV